MSHIEHIHSEQSIFQKGFVPRETSLLQELGNLIEQYFKDHKDAGFYANQLGISIRQLNKLLYLKDRPSLQQCIQMRVYKEAVNLIKYTNMSMKEISYELQLNEPAYFTRWFKKNSGYPPFQFRALHRK